MEKQPVCRVGVDQFTVVLHATVMPADLDDWQSEVNRMVQDFKQRSEIEAFLAGWCQ